MKKYLVRTPVLHNGTRFAMGASISLTTAEAASLSVHVSLLPGQDAEKQTADNSVIEDSAQNSDNGSLSDQAEPVLTNAKLSEFLTQQGVEHSSRAKKADLEALVATLDPELVEAFKAEQASVSEAQGE